MTRPCLIKPEIRRAYEEMAADEAREAEALEWSEGLPANDLQAVERAIRLQLGLSEDW